MPLATDRQIESALQNHQQGDLTGAMAAYRQILTQAPGDTLATGLLGTALLQSGDAQQALPYLEAAVSKQRNNAGFLGHLAQAYFELTMYADAAEHFRKALRLAPAEAQFQLGLANSLALQGQYAEARRLLERVLARHPQHAMAWFNLGHVLRDLHEPAPAIAAYQKVLALAPDFAEARNALGNVLHTAMQLAAAEREYRLCIRDAPQFLPARQNLVSVLIDQGQFDAAEAACRDILQLDPANAHAHGMLADTFNARGRLVDATRHYAEAARLAPDDIATRISLATKLCDTGDITGGLREFGEVLQQQPIAQPAMPELHQALSTMFLAHGFLAEGWAHYRQRPAFIAFRDKLAGVTLTQTLPEILAGLPISVLREQGLGDEIFFLRYARLLTQRGARVTYRCSDAIASLIKRLPDVAEVIASDAAVPACYAAIMAGDLPHALGNLPIELGGADPLWGFPWTQAHYCALPQPSIRIDPLPDRVAQMRAQLAEIGPPPYIGVTWRGGTPPSEQGAGSWVLFKNVAIAQLGAALKPCKGTFIALQRNPEPGEIAALEATLGAKVHDFTHKNKALEDMHALLALIDEYVGVSNTNMHLRAAAGKTARVLVPAPAEWRWMATGDASPWFPGFSVYRQSLHGTWDAALSQLQHDLTAR